MNASPRSAPAEFVHYRRGSRRAVSDTGWPAQRVCARGRYERMLAATAAFQEELMRDGGYGDFGSEARPND